MFSLDQILQAMAKVHVGVCKVHQTCPKLHMQLNRLGYYCLTMVDDCLNSAKRYFACQLHGNFKHQPVEPPTQHVLGRLQPWEWTS